MRNLISAACSVSILILATTSGAQDFPYREKYPEVNIIELTDMKTGYDNQNLIIVDVRSEAEFEAIHIKNALNISYANSQFTNQLREIYSKNSNKKIVVYDNGVDCIKSYKAAEDAMYAMINDVYAFDAGITAWARTYASETLLMGTELKNPLTQLIKEEELNKRYLDFDTFKKKAASENAVIIDARDPVQRAQQVLPGAEKALPIPVDKLVNNIIRKGHMRDKQLYIFDQVGRQVKWLIYYLEENKYTDFYFLEGGATAVLKEQAYRMTASR